MVCRGFLTCEHFTLVIDFSLVVRIQLAKHLVHKELRLELIIQYFVVA